MASIGRTPRLPPILAIRASHHRTTPATTARVTVGLGCLRPRTFIGVRRLEARECFQLGGESLCVREPFLRISGQGSIEERRVRTLQPASSSLIGSKEPSRMRYMSACTFAAWNGGDPSNTDRRPRPRKTDPSARRPPFQRSAPATCTREFRRRLPLESTRRFPTAPSQVQNP
jgi:hypothetical protein